MQQERQRKNNYPMNTFMTMSLPSDIHYARIASKTAMMVAEFFSGQSGIAEKREEFCHAFELAVAEAFANSVFNAAPQEKERQVMISFSSEKSELMVSVSDANPEFDPEMQAPDILSYPEHGYGLVLIRQLMDSVRYSRQDGMNQLSMIKNAG